MNDLISRQAALTALGEEPPVWYDGEDEIAERNQWRRDVAAIKALPPAQPERQSCDGCKHMGNDFQCSRCVRMAHDNYEPWEGRQDE